MPVLKRRTALRTSKRWWIRARGGRGFRSASAQRVLERPQSAVGRSSLVSPPRALTRARYPTARTCCTR